MRRTDEAGSMTVVTVGLVVIAVTLAATLAVAGGMAAAQTRAQGAADASALAAAYDARDRRALGFAYRSAHAPSCRVAGEVSERWGGIVTSCVVSAGGVVSVEVTMPAPLSDARATARAGPRRRSLRGWGRAGVPGSHRKELPPGRAKRATR